MIFNIPQFIDKEDKIVGPLTGKQLGWIAGGGVIILLLWNVFETTTFFIIALPVAALTGALAFYRPYNQPFIAFLASSVFFFIRTKMYAWKRLPDTDLSIRKAPVNKNSPITPKKSLDSKTIKEVSSLLDKQK